MGHALIKKSVSDVVVSFFFKQNITGRLDIVFYTHITFLVLFISVNRSKAGMKLLAKENSKWAQNASSCMMDFLSTQLLVIKLNIICKIYSGVFLISNT
jgi:hypothetical protein